MTRQSWSILFIAYILGLLSTGFIRFQGESFAVSYGQFLALIWLSLGVFVGLIFNIYRRKFFKRFPNSFLIWAIAGGIAALSVFYIDLRLPQPTPNDISQIVEQVEDQITVTGKILDTPAVTRKQRIRFIFRVQQVENYPNLTGKLYVTLPLLQGTGLVPQQTVTLTGRLYRPQPPTNPGVFDFAEYLAEKGIFAGFSGTLTTPPTETPWGGWMLRQRVVQPLVEGLGSPEGLLVSGMVLGRRVVDLPYDVQDQFIQAGLAHILSASGFHVSLLLGVVLAITARFSPRQRLGVGLGVLVIYVSLTGLQPPILRAALMGVAGLVALTLERRVRPLGLLLVTAVILLLFNPLWVFSVSFQLSFLATFGLVVTVPALLKILDWLPPTIASLWAVPVAATVWTLPLVLYHFNVLATYSILVNMVATPLILVVSLGGMLSGFVGVFAQAWGSAIASWLHYPTLALLQGVHWVVNLPGSSFTVGQLQLSQVLGLYACFIAFWLGSKWRWFLGVVAVSIAIAPLLYNNLQLSQITVLDTQNEPIIIVQDRGQVVLINAGDEDTAHYTLLPFFASQGINQIDVGIALSSQNPLFEGWGQILGKLEVKQLFNNPKTLETVSEARKVTQVQAFHPNHNTVFGDLSLTRLNPALLQLQFKGQTWLIITSQLWQEGTVISTVTPQVLVFTGDSLPQSILQQVQVQTAIAISPYLSPQTYQPLTQNSQNLYITGQTGAVQWTPKQGFRAFYSKQRPKAEGRGQKAEGMSKGEVGLKRRPET